MTGQLRRRFAQVDVFADGAFTGNPVAVVLDAEELSTEQMQRFTDWTNLSEATFVLPATEPGADYRVRIFCPGRELPFAGHPTLGTCAAWLAAGGAPRSPERVVQECGVGLVPIRRDGDRLAFAAPALVRSGPVAEDEVEWLLTQLGIDAADVEAAQWVDNGPGWLALLLRSVDAVHRVALPATPIPGLDVGLVAFHPDGGTSAIEVRALFDTGGGRVREDPVTGSLNASVAQWLLSSGRIRAPYVAAQGRLAGHDGKVFVSQADGEVWVGGRAAVAIEGSVEV